MKLRQALSRSAIFAALGFGAISSGTAACGWDPSKPFEREAPEVREAIGHLDGGDARAANLVLTEYLGTGVCKEGNIGTPPRVKERSNASFDLGLALFKVAEAYGRRFGEEEIEAGVLDEQILKAQRGESVECALKIARAVATDPDQPVALRARARYLEGNLLFLNASYEEAVRAYDHALELAPGMGDAGPLGASDARPWAPDPVGQDAAYNRAIALRRIEDKKDAGKDAQSDSPGEGGGDGGGGQSGDAGKDGGGGQGGDGGKDAGGHDSGSQDAGGDDQDPEKQKPPKPKEEQGKDAGAPPPSRQSQDERILDQLESAPTVQQEAAKKQGRARRVRGMADK